MVCQLQGLLSSKIIVFRALRCASISFLFSFFSFFPFVSSHSPFLPFLLSQQSHLHVVKLLWNVTTIKRWPREFLSTGYNSFFLLLIYSRIIVDPDNRVGEIVFPWIGIYIRGDMVLINNKKNCTIKCTFNFVRLYNCKNIHFV